jgi:hypothetical protein
MSAIHGSGMVAKLPSISNSNVKVSHVSVMAYDLIVYISM